jgi:hypothetical protein
MKGLDMKTVAQVMQETIEKVSVPTITSRQYKGAIRQAGVRMKQVVGTAMQAQKQKGRPSTYTKAIGNVICERIGSGETLKGVCADLGLSFHAVMGWIEKDEIFRDAYRLARRNMSVSLVDTMLEESKTITNEQALAARVKADIIKWTASKFSPAEFGEIKRIELKGEVNHRHTHELAPEQKRRIAESWLVSQDQNETLPAITTFRGVLLPAVAFRRRVVAIP